MRLDFQNAFPEGSLQRSSTLSIWRRRRLAFGQDSKTWDRMEKFAKDFPKHLQQSVYQTVSLYEIVSAVERMDGVFRQFCDNWKA